jgi:hypothetical protein
MAAYDLQSLVPLVQSVGELKKLAPGAAVPSYRRINQHVADATIPAVRIGGRWFLRTEDLPQIAEILGLTVTASPLTA